MNYYHPLRDSGLGKRYLTPEGVQANLIHTPVIIPDEKEEKYIWIKFMLQISSNSYAWRDLKILVTNLGFHYHMWLENPEKFLFDHFDWAPQLWAHRQVSKPSLMPEENLTDLMAALGLD